MKGEPRTYRVNLTCVGPTGVSFRRKMACTGKTKDEAELDAIRRIRAMFPRLREVKVGGGVWLKSGI